MNFKRPNRLSSDRKEINYISLSYSGVDQQRGSDELEFHRADQSIAEVMFLAGQAGTALMAMCMEGKQISLVMEHIHEVKHFQHIQYLLNTHQLMHSPVRQQYQVQALSDSEELAANPEEFIASISEREALYLNSQMVIKGQNTFITINDIPTALQELTDQVSRHGYKIKSVYDHYLTSKHAFTPDQVLAINRAVGLRCLAGKTGFKQIRAMLMEKHKMSQIQVESQFTSALGKLEWLKTGDLDFTEAVYDGKITIERLAELRPLSDILEILIDAPGRALTAKHLCHHPTLIMSLAQTCSRAIATRAARYVAQALMNPKLQGHTALLPLIEWLDGYQSHPDVNFNLCMLKRANGLITSEELAGRLKPRYKDSAIKSGLTKVVKHPEDLSTALKELAISIPPSLMRRNGKSFTTDLGV